MPEQSGFSPLAARAFSFGLNWPLSPCRAPSAPVAAPSPGGTPENSPTVQPWGIAAKANQVPPGTPDHSPPIYRWVTYAKTHQVPSGTKAPPHPFPTTQSTEPITPRRLSFAPPGLDPFHPSLTTVETVGYSLSSLTGLKHSRLTPHRAPSASVAAPSPGGTPDNSPPIYRWVTWSKTRQVPSGTKEPQPRILNHKHGQPPGRSTGLQPAWRVTRPQSRLQVGAPPWRGEECNLPSFPIRLSPKPLPPKPSLSFASPGLDRGRGQSHILTSFPLWTTLPRMARKLRVEYAGAIYHVMNRGDRREAIFLDDPDQELFLATLAEACAKTGWGLHGVSPESVTTVLVPEDH